MLKLELMLRRKLNAEAGAEDDANGDADVAAVADADADDATHMQLRPHAIKTQTWSKARMREIQRPETFTAAGA